MAAGQSCYNDRIPTSFEHMTDDLNSFYEGFDPHELKRMVHGALTHGNVCFLRTIAKTNCLKDIVKEAQFYIHSIGSVTAFAYYLNAHPKDREGAGLMMDIFDGTDPDGKAMRVALITRNKYVLDVFKQSLIIGDQHSQCVWEALDLNNFDMLGHLLPFFDSKIAAAAVQRILDVESRGKNSITTPDDFGKRAVRGVERVFDVSPNPLEVLKALQTRNHHAQHYSFQQMVNDFYHQWASKNSKKELEAHVGGMGLASKPSKM